jgi:putative transposase
MYFANSIFLLAIRRRVMIGIWATPTDNAHIESFNGTLRDEFLNVNWFQSINEAKELCEAWRRDYNESRPHMAHNGKTPAEFAEYSGLCQSEQVQIAAGF